jgi:L-fuconolactonase
MPQRISRAVKGLAGVRVHILGRAAAALLAAGRLDALLARCSDLGRTILYWCRHPAAFDLYADIAVRFPRLNAVIDHMGYTSMTFGSSEESLDRLLALARHPRIHVKLSIQYQHSRDPYPWRDMFELQRRIIAAFGSKRCCWGSNWPMQIPTPTYAARFSAMRDEYPFRSPEERAQVMHDTAATLWPVTAAR